MKLVWSNFEPVVSPHVGIFVVMQYKRPCVFATPWPSIVRTCKLFFYSLVCLLFHPNIITAVIKCHHFNLMCSCTCSIWRRGLRMASVSNNPITEVSQLPVPTGPSEAQLLLEQFWPKVSENIASINIVSVVCCDKHFNTITYQAHGS